MPGSQVGTALTMSLRKLSGLKPCTLFGAMAFGAGTDNSLVPNFYRNRH